MQWCRTKMRSSRQGHYVGTLKSDANCTTEFCPRNRMWWHHFRMTSSRQGCYARLCRFPKRSLPSPCQCNKQTWQPQKTWLLYWESETKNLPLNCGISPVGLLGSPLWHASLVKATVTPQLPSKKPICWLPASWMKTSNKRSHESNSVHEVISLLGHNLHRHIQNRHTQKTFFSYSEVLKELGQWLHSVQSSLYFMLQ